jgi:hypothetical protein
VNKSPIVVPVVPFVVVVAAAAGLIPLVGCTIYSVAK